MLAAGSQVVQPQDRTLCCGWCKEESQCSISHWSIQCMFTVV